MRQVAGLFGLVCLVGGVVAPFLGIALLVMGGSGPSFSSQVHAAGQSIRIVKPTTLWAKPASVDVSSITCTADEFGGSERTVLTPGGASDGRSTATSSQHGSLRYVASTTAAGFSVGSVTCTGPGLTAIVTARDSGTIGKHAGIAFLVAAPILLTLGVGIRRAGFR